MNKMGALAPLFYFFELNGRYSYKMKVPKIVSTENRVTNWPYQN